MVLRIGFELSTAAAALSVFSLGCASAPASSRSPEVVVATAQTKLIEHAADAGVASKVNAAPAQAYAALKQAYAALGIPISSDDAGAVKIGNPQFVLHHRFAGEPLSSYFNCGSGLAGPHANSASVYVSLESTIAPSDGGSELRTSVSAIAIEPEHGADRLNCGSTGRLESRIADQVNNILGK